METKIIFIVLISSAWAFYKVADPVQQNSVNVIGRITNGKEADPHSIPYQAYLIILRETVYVICGGSLISPKYILTAAHCIKDGVDSYVYLGAHNIKIQESTQVIFNSNKFIIHENYDETTISNDIGLIELPQPVALNENINVAHLPSRGAGTYEGKQATASGWGRTSGNGVDSAVLMEVSSYVISNQECSGLYLNVRNTEICISGDRGVGTCNGDSGGPLVSGGIQIGVDSYGARVCAPGFPSVFTRISSFLDWLEKHTDLKF